MGKPSFILLGIIILAVLAGFFLDFKPSLDVENLIESRIKKVFLGGQHISVEVADTQEEQALGLSGRASLGEQEGMLFVWKSPVTPYFWMKDMRFPLDIIWIDEHRIVVGIEYGIPISSFPRTFSPEIPVLYVLEMNAGWAERNGVVFGNRAEW